MIENKCSACGFVVAFRDMTKIHQTLLECTVVRATWTCVQALVRGRRVARHRLRHGPVPEHDEVARLGRADAGKREPREQALGPARRAPRERGRALALAALAAPIGVKLPKALATLGEAGAWLKCVGRCRRCLALDEWIPPSDAYPQVQTSALPT